MNNSDNPIQKSDQIGREFQTAWEAGEQPDISCYLTGLADAAREELLNALIPIDIQFRVDAGEVLQSDTYSRYGRSAVAIADKLLQQESETKENPADPFGTIPGAGSVAHSQSNRQPDPVFDENNKLLADRYRLINQIGKGGMGSVWLAQQEKPVRRRVAIKVINDTLGSTEAISRFEAERQALAMMNHPNIAKVLDAGTTQDDRPFFVMELVKGVPITQYCKTQHLSNRQRLELMITVCEAVQHAHQKGIIHRDLKPTNILVTVEGDHPVPKVIDFGLAKALESGTKLTDQTIVTEYGRVVGTLQYMSPEQAGSNQLDVDTRTDVYSIGVLLYQLLTDIIPLDEETISGRSLLQIIELICESEIPRPSVRLARDESALNEAAKRRHAEPAQLMRSLKGELDWIVQKSLEKDRVNRYQTANGVAMDIKRFLNNEPIAARPPSNTYLLKKLLKKYQGLAISALAAGLLLIAGIVFTTNSWLKADHAKKEALQAKDLAVKQLDVFKSSFSSTNPLKGAEKNMTATDVLDNAKSNLEKKGLDEYPLSKAELMHAIGQSYSGLSDYQSAIEMFEGAVNLRESNGKEREALESLKHKAIAYSELQKQKSPNQKRPEQLLKIWENWYENASKFAESEDEMNRLDYSMGLGYFAVFKEMGKKYKGTSKKVKTKYIDSAVEFLERVNANLAKQAKGDASPALFRLKTQTNLANIYLKQGDFKKAIRLSEELIQKWEDAIDKFDASDPKRKSWKSLFLMLRNNYAEALTKAGRLDEAIAEFEYVMDRKAERYSIWHESRRTSIRLCLKTMIDARHYEAASQLIKDTRTLIGDEKKEQSSYLDEPYRHLEDSLNDLESRIENIHKEAGVSD